MTRGTPIFMSFLAALAGVHMLAADQNQAAAVSAAWNPAAAAKYLDDRMDLWFTNAKKLRTGDEKTTCVSCHSSIPYALARPALRRAMHASAPAAQEARLVEETTRRLESYGAHEVLYEMNDVKKSESRGTEAVLNTVVLASADVAAGRKDAGGATRKALERLWEIQRPDGAWDWLNFKLEPYETVDAVYHGATLAAIGVGMVPGAAGSSAAGAGRLRTYLRDNFAAQNLYNRTFALLASSGLADVLSRAQRDALIAELGQRQQADGGWSLQAMGPWRWSATEPPFKPQGTPDPTVLAQSDGFATGLIVYALLRNGQHADQPIVSAGVRWLKTHQQEIHVDDQTWTAWLAYSLDAARVHRGPRGDSCRGLFMSAAATAFSVLALLEVEPK